MSPQNEHPLVIRGRILHNGRLQPGAVGIDPETGLVTGVGPDLKGDEVHDHGDHLVLPGAVDIHVHFRDPGHPEKEDFASGTLSALHGGVTTVFDMPNTDPPTVTLERLQAKRQVASEKAHVDWELYGGITKPGPDLADLAAETPVLKLYMGESTGAMTFEDPDALGEVLDQLHAVDYDGILTLHAEDGPMLEAAMKAHAAAEGLAGHDARRPVAAEIAALHRLEESYRRHVSQHGEPGFRIHIAHVSSHALQQYCAASPFSYGVTPNHLFLDHTMDLGARGRMNPPLRTPGDAQTLMVAMAAGLVPIVESDHAPHTKAEKDRPVQDAPSGIPGVETTRALLLAHVAQHDLPLGHVVAATSTEPARLTGLAKGRLAAGYDADVTVYDMPKVTTIRGDNLHSRAGWTPFEGHQGIFPTHVYLRGRLALEGDTVHVRAGDGRRAVRRAT